jgi:EmrB/QacA subfamily drug resistance transporter
MPQTEVDPVEKRYRLIAIIIVMLGVTMSAIDTTAVVLGLPVMIKDLNSDVLSMIWVLLAYLLVITILGTQVGRLGDMFGRVRMYNLGFAVFTIGSLFCGISSDANQLIAFRVLQGVGGALISSNSGAIIADTFSQKERGKAFGYAGLGWSIGAILGILVGGAFVTFLTWRYIFFINLPIGIVATIAGYYLLQERSPRKKESLDLSGIFLLALSLFLFLYSITSITGSGWSLEYGTELVIGVAAFFSFIFWERRSKAPFLDLTMFQDRIFRASSLAAFFQSLASYAVIFLVIMYLQGPRGMTPWDASLLLIPGFVLGGLIAPFSGRLSDRHGARVIASIGLVMQMVGILVFSTLGLTTTVYLVVLGSVLNGAGTSTFFPANTSAVMANAPPQHYGITSGLLRTMSNLGMVSSFAVALFFASISVPRDVAFRIFLGTGGLSSDLAGAFIDGMRSAFLVSIALLVVALSLSILRGKEERASRRQ